jgi:ribosomal RNA-processing protein 12
MAETETDRVALKSNLEELIRNVLDTTAAASATAKRARLSLISYVASLMDPTDLYFVPSILSEVIVATKEVNEKTRDVAYDLLVAMGHKMKAGGIFSSERVGDMEGAPSETQATISEYFTMATAGLAGTTPHMVCRHHVVVKALVRVPQGSRPSYGLGDDQHDALVCPFIQL